MIEDLFHPTDPKTKVSEAGEGENQGLDRISGIGSLDIAKIGFFSAN
jgi:hypothetical protein